MSIIYPEESYAIIGACFEVYNVVRSGFQEPIYQECLELEFAMRTMPCRPQVELPLTYKDRVLTKYLKPDFDCYSKIILEIKAVSRLDDSHRAQVHSYLKLTKYKLGLLVNFGAHGELEYERIVV